MTTYQFVLTPYDPMLAPELSRALEKRTELSSRKKYPVLWRQNDRLHAFNERNKKIENSKGRRLLRTVMTAVLLLLGLFLLIPGLMEPEKLREPLIVGSISVLYALLRILLAVLSRRGRRQDPRYEAAAGKMLAKLRQLDTAVHPRVVFSKDEMRIEDDDSCGRFRLDVFDTVIETPNLFVMTYDGNVTALKKTDLIGAELDDFRAFLTEKNGFPIQFVK